MKNRPHHLRNIHSPLAGFMRSLLHRKFWSRNFILIATFCSALAVIYVTAEDRIMFSDLVVEENNRDHLHLVWGQLLLEQSTWSTQSRVEATAEEKLDMVLPIQNTIVMVEE